MRVRQDKAMTTMRIDPANLDILAKYRERGESYDDVLSLLLKTLKIKKLDFRRELA